MPKKRKLAELLAVLHCPHHGEHEEWSYKVGSGLASLYCIRCGKVVLTCPVDDLSAKFLKKLKANNAEPDEADGE